MVELGCGFGTIVLDGPGQAGQAGDKSIFMGTDVLGIAGQFVHRAVSHTDHGRAAPCPAGIKVQNLVRDFKVPTHAQVHGRQVNPVAQFKLVDLDGVKQGIMHGRLHGVNYSGLSPL